MSITYVAVTTADSKLVGPLLEGSAPPEGLEPMDQLAVHAAITTQTKLVGNRNQTLKFEGPDGGYLFASVLPTHVLVTHNTVDDEDVLMEIIDLLATLTDVGLNVWDPQQGSWFPGSPALKRKSTKTKPRKAKPAKRKPKPAAKTRSAKPKSKAKKR